MCRGVDKFVRGGGSTLLVCVCNCVCNCVCTSVQNDKMANVFLMRTDWELTDKQVDRQTDGQTNRWIDRQMDRQSSTGINLTNEPSL